MKQLVILFLFISNSISGQAERLSPYQRYEDSNHEFTKIRDKKISDNVKIVTYEHGCCDLFNIIRYRVFLDKPVIHYCGCSPIKGHTFYVAKIDVFEREDDNPIRKINIVPYVDVYSTHECYNINHKQWLIKAFESYIKK